MTTKTWNGTSGNFTDAANWSPAGTPTSGDIAVINAGTVAVSGTIAGIEIDLNEAANATGRTALALNGATIGSGSTFVVNNQQSGTSAPSPLILVSGTTEFAGTGTFNGSRIEFAIDRGSTLHNTGTMTFYGSSPLTSGDGTLQNDGTIAFVNPVSVAQVPDLVDAITGIGIIALGEHARLQIDGAVGAGQTVVFNDDGSGNELLQINAGFGGTIKGFSSTDRMFLTGVQGDSVSYAAAGAHSGVLTISSGGTVVDTLSFLGDYTTASFALAASGTGSQLTATANNEVSQGLPSGYQNGGNPAGGSQNNGNPASANPAGDNPNGTQAVYRFFDTKFGTHLFTQDAGEANNIVATRPDLVQETNGFGAVAQGSATAESVYRFFNTSDGTHFFTASVDEFKGLTTKGSSTFRADLTYESNSTFYESANQQAGETAVYRFFDTVKGTQFLTGDQGEYNTLTTAGSNGYRPDLRYEGISFYAPTGTFHT